MSESKDEIKGPSLKIGIDFGGVLSIHDTPADTSSGHRSTAINVNGAVETLKKLKSKGHELFLISFCGRSRAVETANAIEKQIPGLFSHLFFVKDKKFKKDLVRALGCDIMIDDTVDIISDVDDQKLNCQLIWFTGDPNLERPESIPKWNKGVELSSWKSVADFIENDSDKKDFKEPNIEKVTQDCKSKLYILK